MAARQNERKEMNDRTGITRNNLHSQRINKDITIITIVSNN